jgi:two-component system, LytTR family, response regulator
MAASTANAYVQPNGSLPGEVREYPKKIVIRSQNRIFLQTVSEIEHLTAAANYVQIHAAGQVFRIRSTINAIEQRLDPKKFGRIHRCTIVNFDCVKEFRALQRGDYLLVLNDGSQLKMSRRHREQLEKLTCASGSHLVKYGSARNENSGLAPTNPVGGRGPALV